MEYRERIQTILAECNTYEDEKVIMRLVDTCELNYAFLDDCDKVQIDTTDPSQILYLQKRNINIEYTEKYEPANFFDPLLE